MRYLCYFYSMDKLFKLKFIKPDDTELSQIGFDQSYIKKGLEKHKFTSVKIYDLSSAQANILKQTALSCGTDCAVHREVITGRVEQSDCILSGSLSQFKKIAEKLKYQPLKLNELGKNLNDVVFKEPEPLVIRETVFDWGSRTYIMGIVNVTPDSFSDGGEFFDPKKALVQALRLIEDGADIIDIGGESTRPYSEKVDTVEEIKRIKPVVEAIRKYNKNIPISIDTRNSQTAKAALETGADMINDVSACEWDCEMLNVIKEFNAPIILNHSKGAPDEMQSDTHYNDLLEEVHDYLQLKLEHLSASGVDLSRVIVDTGIGFGKSCEQNYELIKNTNTFKSLGCPMLVGHSRKSFLQQSLDIKDKDNDVLDSATNAVSSYLMNQGVDILRVHNVKALKLLVDVNKHINP